ncbi:chromate transporter [Mesorhizobium loti]|uniref:chromate transporter n=1 Tax=Rhizobium loti TaxID=381 RepID=UPI001929ECDE|nr:chromate transporter [Mesorhizobium loti]
MTPGSPAGAASHQAQESVTCRHRPWRWQFHLDSGLWFSCSCSNKEMAAARTLNMSEPETPPAPSCSQLFWIFTRIALTSFGGGLSGWLLREFVQNRKWMTQEEFLNGLSISQALPGVNVKNMAVWIGYRLLGWRGAIIGFVGIIVPPAIVIVLLGTLFSSLSRYPLTHVALTGAAAAAVGLSLSMGITAARALPRNAFPIAIMAATFVAVALLHWPLFWVVLAAGFVSVAYAYARAG